MNQPCSAENFLIRAGKQYIHTCKCKNEKVNFKTFIKGFNELYTVEKYIAIKEGKLEKHCKKWKPYIGEVDRDNNFVT